MVTDRGAGDGQQPMSALMPSVVNNIKHDIASLIWSKDLHLQSLLTRKMCLPHLRFGRGFMYQLKFKFTAGLLLGKCMKDPKPHSQSELILGQGCQTLFYHGTQKHYAFPQRTKCLVRTKKKKTSFLVFLTITSSLSSLPYLLYR